MTQILTPQRSHRRLTIISSAGKIESSYKYEDIIVTSQSKISGYPRVLVFDMQPVAFATGRCAACAEGPAGLRLRFGIELE